PGGCSDGDISKALAHLEGTYVLRVFAEFEAALRTIYQRIRKRAAMPRVKVSLLIDWLSRNSMPDNVRKDAHRVREYRNSLAHEGGSEVPISMSQCRSILCTYLSFVPRVP
ncbi:MAG: hypothetical protein NTV86_10975, partial [Planctomycetota bacterium]|nr:hypothetical protein [Planctomycetota bacterium]